MLITTSMILLGRGLKPGFDNLTNIIYREYYGRDPVSPILWGLASGYQDFPQVTDTTGDWSWGKAREYYYMYLTGEGKDANGNAVTLTQEQREAAFANCFQAVGQIMHLLEDTSVPLHTQNDLHVFPITKIPFKDKDLPVPIGRWTYETFTIKNLNILDFNPHMLVTCHQLSFSAIRTRTQPLEISLQLVAFLTEICTLGHYQLSTILL